MNKQIEQVKEALQELINAVKFTPLGVRGIKAVERAEAALSSAEVAPVEMTDAAIDELADAYDLRSIQDNGRVDGYALRAFARALLSQQAAVTDHMEGHLQMVQPAAEAQAAPVDTEQRARYTAWAEVFYRNAERFTNRDHVIGWNAWITSATLSQQPAVRVPEDSSKDTERLDCLEQALRKGCHIYSRKGKFAINPSINYEFDVFPTLRAALDQAIAAAPAQDGGN